MNSKFIIILTAIVVILVLSTGAYYFWSISKVPVKSTPAPVQKIQPVVTQQAEKIDATTTTTDKLIQEDKSLDTDMKNLDDLSKNLDSKLNEVQPNLDY